MTEEKNLYSPANNVMVKTSITHYEFSASSFGIKSKTISVDDITLSGTKTNKNWIRVIGLKDYNIIHSLATKFNIHALVTEDILHTVQRPKIEEYDDLVYVVLKMFYVKNIIKSQQVSIVVKDNLIITFEEHESICFNRGIERIQKDEHISRKKGEDYFLYFLLDQIIDDYFSIEELLFKEVSKIEDLLNVNPKRTHLTRLIKLRKELMLIKKAIVPVVDIVFSLSRSEIKFFDKENKVFLRDLNDHVLRTIDNIDTHRETVNGLIEMYHAEINTKMNEVMKTLTIMSSIFIPLTFIVGIYGMNFKHMPELETQYGYFVTLGVMLFIAIALLIYFRIKKYY